MKLKQTKALYDYWNRLRGNEDAPFRSQIDPTSFRHLLPDVFILQCDSDTEYPFRIAGTRLCSNIGAELRGRNFLDLWAPNEREGLESVLMSAKENAAAAVLGIKATTDDGRTAEFELVLLPLRLSDHTCAQVIGAFAPYKAEHWLGHVPITAMTITGLRLIWPNRMPVRDEYSPKELPADRRSAQKPVFQPSVGTRSERPKLVVIEGGLSDKVAELG